MNGLAQQLVRYGVLLVAGNVFLEQLGLPIPAMPLFVVAGALVAQGRLAGPQLLLAVLGAALLADTLWFFLGRKYGWHILRFLCGLSLSADTCVRKTSSAYDRFGLRALLFAKFIPGLSAVSVPVAGALKAPFLRFLGYDAAGTLIWAGTGIGLGAVFHEQVEVVLDLLRRFGTGALGILASAFAVYVAFRLWRRQQTLATLRMARLTPRPSPLASSRETSPSSSWTCGTVSPAGTTRARSPALSSPTSASSTRSCATFPSGRTSPSTARDGVKPRRPVWHASSSTAGTGTCVPSRAASTPGSRPASRRSRSTRSCKPGPAWKARALPASPESRTRIGATRIGARHELVYSPKRERSPGNAAPRDRRHAA